MKMIRCTLANNQVALINPSALIVVESRTDDAGFYVAFKCTDDHARTLSVISVEFDYDISAVSKTK